MEFRLNNKIDCSIFDVLGKTEPEQTKGLGYLIAKSPNAMKALLKLIDSQKLYKKNYIVDCEATQNTVYSDNYKKRADIIIRFYDENKQPIKAIIIEAKSAALYGYKKAEEQVKLYCIDFDILKEFKENVIKATLTTIKSYTEYDDVLQITWADLINSLYKSAEIIVEESFEKSLITDYINYINKINGNMNFYDKEVLSIPAGETGEIVKTTFIYACPDKKGQSNSRANSHPLYLTFRAGGNQCGRMEMLYKVKEIIKINYNDQEKIDRISSIYFDFKKRIEPWIDHAKKKNNKNIDRWVFILDKDNSIKLPNPVEYFDKTVGINGNKRGNDYILLKDMLSEAEYINGNKIVKLPKR